MSANFNNQMKRGQFELLDDVPQGSEDLANALNVYTDYINSNKSSSRWLRTVAWIENTLFGVGRQYYDNALISRITQNSQGNLHLNEQIKSRIPQPTNDLLGRYIETNISLLTENRPIPRITAKSDSLEDKQAAELSELNIEFLWEELGLPAKHREIARMILYTGTCFLETYFDPFIPRYLALPVKENSPTTLLPSGIEVPIPSQKTKIDPKTGAIVTEQEVGYGDIVSNVVTPFEMHFPSGHWWDDDRFGWVIKESYCSIDSLKQKFLNPKVDHITTKKNGYLLDNLEKLGRKPVQDLPLWWWERLSDVVEGPGSTLYGGTPELWEDFTTVKVLDRKPSYKWPQGRTVIIAGDSVIYDSPKRVGARVFDKRWPKRWHPYTRYQWEGQLGSLYGRSLVSKLLPKLKRVNSIDVTLIMWRRTVPISTWIAPKGCVIKGSKCLLSNGKIELIEQISNTQVQSLDKSRSIIRKFEYDNDEDIYSVKVKGNLPIKATGNHNIPTITREVFKEKVKRKINDEGGYCYNYNSLTLEDIQDLPFSRLNKGDYLLSSFFRERLNEKIDLSKFNIKQTSHIKLSQYIKLDEKFLRLAGIYLAEGCLINQTGKIGGIKFTLHEKEQVTLGVEIQNYLFEIFGLDSFSKIETNNNGHTRCVISCYNNTLGKVFKILFSEGAKNKSIHDDIFYASTSLLPLVGGWFDGDGCYHKKVKNKTFRMLNGSSISENLISQLRSILLDENIASTVDVQVKNRPNPKYRLQIASSHYLTKLQPYCNKLTDISFTKTSEQGFWLNNIYCSKIKDISIEKYEGKVYDLEIEDLHYYQVNGIIVHNSSPIEGINSGEPGTIWTYDPSRTHGAEPKPVYPAPFPSAALQEREMQIAEMESIAGTEQILRGERPVGVNSAAMFDALRKQALASRSPILQAWDESLQTVAHALNQETIKHIKDDSYYRDRINLLAREKSSQFSIDQFSGQNLQDNVIVRVDTASMAFLAREARQERALQVINYGPNLTQLPPNLQAKLLTELGWPDALVPSGPDITRARAMIQYIKGKRFDLAIPMPEDDPYIMHEMLVVELKNESFMDLPVDVQMKMFQITTMYRDQIVKIEQAKMQQAIQMGQMGQPQGGGQM